MAKTRVVLADDHVLVRVGIRSLIERMPSVEVAAEASHGREALKAIEEHLPDVVLLDLAMPGMSGLEVLSRVSRRFPNVRIVMLSMHDNEEYVIRALDTGAAGYLLKDAAVAELEEAIRAVVAGETYLSCRISKSVIASYLERTKEREQGYRLTPREREIAQLVAEGRTTKEIGALLKLSVKTVDGHRGHFMRKLGIKDIPGLVRYAMREGLVPPEPGKDSPPA
jgi:DNA-binding NarL/FixJ family response regulator